MINLSNNITKEDLERLKKIKTPNKCIEGFEEEVKSDRKIWVENKDMRNFIQ